MSTTLKTNSPIVVELATTLGLTRTKSLQLLRQAKGDANAAAQLYLDLSHPPPPPAADTEAEESRSPLPVKQEPMSLSLKDTQSLSSPSLSTTISPIDLETFIRGDDLDDIKRLHERAVKIEPTVRGEHKAETGESESLTSMKDDYVPLPKPKRTFNQLFGSSSMSQPLSSDSTDNYSSHRSTSLTRMKSEADAYSERRVPIPTVKSEVSPMPAPAPSRDGKYTVHVDDSRVNAPVSTVMMRLIPHYTFDKVYRAFESKGYIEPTLYFGGVAIGRTDTPACIEMYDNARLILKYKAYTAPNRPAPVTNSISQSQSQPISVKRERSAGSSEAIPFVVQKRARTDVHADDGSSSLTSPPSADKAAAMPVNVPSYPDRLPWFNSLHLGKLEISFRSVELATLTTRYLQWPVFLQSVQSRLLVLEEEPSEFARRWQALSLAAGTHPARFAITIKVTQSIKHQPPPVPAASLMDIDDEFDDDDEFDGQYRGRRSRLERMQRRVAATMLQFTQALADNGSEPRMIEQPAYRVHSLSFDIALTPQAIGVPIEGLNDLFHHTLGPKFDRMRKATFGEFHRKTTTPPMDIHSVLSLAQRHSFHAQLKIDSRMKREVKEEKRNCVSDSGNDSDGTIMEQCALHYLKNECQRGLRSNWDADWVAANQLTHIDLSHMCQSRLILRDYQMQSVLWMLGQELQTSLSSWLWQPVTIGSQSLFYSPLLQMLRTGPLEDTRGGILADSMGLGKTCAVMAVSNINPPSLTWSQSPPSPSNEVSQRSRATLIIAPSSLVGQWVTELSSHSSKPLKILTFYGSNRPSNPVIVADNDFVLTTPDVLANDIDHRRSHSSDANIVGPLFQIEWWRVVVDEGHSLKDTSSKRSRACRSIKAHRRWILTGTPMSSTLSNLYGLCAFLHLRVLGDAPSLWSSLDSVAGTGRQAKRTSAIVWPAVNLYRLIQLLMTQLTMRHTKDQTFNGRRGLIELPPVTRTVIKINFTAEQKAAYQQLETYARKRFDALVQSGEAQSKTIVALSYLIPLRQACAGGIIDMDEQKRRDDEAEQRLQAAQRFAAASQHNNANDVDSDSDGDEDSDDSVRRFPYAREPPFNQLDEECTVCLSEFSLPLQTQCNHLYCSGCVLQLIEHEGGSAMCPQCRATITKRRLFRPRKPLEPKPVSVPAPALEEENKATESNATTDTRANSVLFDAKLRVLIDHLLIDQQQDPQSKCLVFTQFNSTLQWIEDNLSRRGIRTLKITGNMSMTKRKRILEQFNSSDSFTVFLLSVRVGAVGLTLTAASRVYLCEPCLNPSLTLQAIGRVVRLGQRKSVAIKQLVMRDSVEELIELVVKDRLKDLESSLSAVSDSSGEDVAAPNFGSIAHDTMNVQLQQLYTLFGR